MPTDPPPSPAPPAELPEAVALRDAVGKMRADIDRHRRYSNDPAFNGLCNRVLAYTTEQRAALDALLAAARQREDEMVALLRELEWTPDSGGPMSTGSPYCRICGGTKGYGGHKFGCVVGARLAGDAAGEAGALRHQPKEESHD